MWDFGCGITGRWLISLWSLGCIVYPTDTNFGISPKEPIDKFLLSCVLHYNDNDTKFDILRKAYEQLKIGGHITIIEPNPFNPFFYCLYFWRWLIRSKCSRRWHNEKYMLSRLNLIFILKLVGFHNIEWRKYAWFPSKFGWLKLNEILNRIPIVNWFNAFNWIRGEK